MKPIKIGEVTYTPAQHVECMFCGGKSFTGIPVVLSCTSPTAICGSCILIFAEHLADDLEAVMDEAAGATHH